MEKNFNDQLDVLTKSFDEGKITSKEYLSAITKICVEESKKPDPKTTRKEFSSIP